MVTCARSLSLHHKAGPLNIGGSACAEEEVIGSGTTFNDFTIAIFLSCLRTCLILREGDGIKVLVKFVLMSVRYLHVISARNVLCSCHTIFVSAVERSFVDGNEICTRCVSSAFQGSDIGVLLSNDFAVHQHLPGNCLGIILRLRGTI